MPTSPAQRNSAFFRKPTQLTGKTTSYLLKQAKGMVLHYQIRTNELGDNPELSFREIEVTVSTSRTRNIVAHGRLYLVEALPQLDPVEALDTAGAVSDEVYELTDVIAGSCAEGLQVFDYGRILALEYYEVCSQSRGTGLGSAIGVEMLNLLATRFRACLTIWKPYPLQFLDTPYDEAPPEVRAQFRAARRRLASQYCQGWGANRLGNSGWLGVVPSHSRIRLQGNSRSWWLADS